MACLEKEEATPWRWVWVCKSSRCQRHDLRKIHAFTDTGAEVRDKPTIVLFGFSHIDWMCCECGSMFDPSEESPFNHRPFNHRADCKREGKIISVGWIDKYSGITYDQRLWVTRSSLPTDVVVYEDADTGYAHDACVVAAPIPHERASTL